MTLRLSAKATALNRNDQLPVEKASKESLAQVRRLLAGGLLESITFSNRRVHATYGTYPFKYAGARITFHSVIPYCRTDLASCSKSALWFLATARGNMLMIFDTQVAAICATLIDE